MCGIIGYAGHRPAVPVIIEGLRRLEYRGYDSAGVGFIQGRELKVIKAEGKLAALEEKLAHYPNTVAMNGIGHTRWATHGVPAERNAHPHIGGNNELAIIHNGIIENASQLRLDLQTEGYHFVSETDTEVAAKLLGKISDKIIAENQLTAMMVTHNMKDAIRIGNRLIMMNSGRIIYDVSGEEKKNLKVTDLLQKFEETSGEDFANDRMLLS